MNLIVKAGCRIFQKAFRLVIPVLPYREPKIVDACDDLKEVFEKEKITSLLIVTDKGIIDHGLIKTVEETCKKYCVEYTIYSGVKPNPTVENVECGLHLYQNSQSQAIIAIGGGSSMDCGKAIGACIANPKKKVKDMKGILRVIHKLPPLIAIPTTAGTGSEVTLASVISDPKNHDKYALMDFPLIPHYAVLDPKMTYTLPKSLTATTGMDALTHAIEAYIGGSTTPKTRRLALDAIKLIYQNLWIAYENPQNEVARRNMSLAAYQAGLAFSMSYVGYIHAIAHSLGGQYDIAHGLANAVVMPYVLKAYGHRIDRKMHDIALVAGVSNEIDRDEDACRKMIASIEALNQKMHIPSHIAEIQEKDIPSLAKHASLEANPLYPVPVLWNAKELAPLYRQIKGE